MDALGALLDLEVTLVQRLGWSLRDLDETDVASVMMFLGRLQGRSAPRPVYCDEIDW